MKINVKVPAFKFPAPNKSQVLALKRKGNGQGVLVYRSPNPSGTDTFTFVGEGSNSYLLEKEWDSFMNCVGVNSYELVGLYNIDNMEVTFNA